MITAGDCCPKKCPNCGHKLPKMVYDDKIWGGWIIDCKHCLTTMVWSWPYNWLVRSKLPLFDTKKDVTLR
jgi:hypothetical protein